MTSIREKLDFENLELFKNSCFGHLLKMNEMKFQGQLFYHLMLHMDDPIKCTGVVRFRFNDRVFIFGPKEYFIITGLQFAPGEALPTSSSIYETIFQSKRLLKLQDIEDAFDVACLQHKGSGELVLKLAHLLVLYGVFLCRDTHCKTVDIQYIHVVDDLSKFASYPWGLVSYTFLVDNLIDTRARLKRMLKKKTKPNFDVYGFTFVLQLWAFEVSREIGAYCGVQLSENEHVTPRMLPWSIPNFFRYSELRSFFAPSKTIDWVDMNLSYEEMRSVEENKLYLEVTEKVSDEIVRPTKVQRGAVKRKIRYSCDGNFPFLRTLPFEVANKRSIRLSNCRLREDSRTILKVLSDFRLSVDVKRMFVQQEAMIEALVTQLCSQHTCVNLPRNDGAGDLPDEANVVCDSVTEVISPKNKVKPNVAATMKKEEVSEVEVVNSKDKIERVVMDAQTGAEEDDENKGCEHISVVVMHSSEEVGVFAPLTKAAPVARTGKSLSDCVLISSEVEETKKMPDLSKKIGELVGEIYDPTAICSEEVVVKQFKDWCKLADSHQTILQLPVSVKEYVRDTWFDTIWKPMSWLTDENMDVLLSFLLVKAHHKPHLFRRRWTVMDLHCWNDFEDACTVVAKYVNGKLPRDRAVSWKEVDNIYGIGHVLKSHWVAYDINLDEQTITVYDSLAKDNH
ncbi:hypothetical protein C2S52_016347 [Perilla frutescens var. hirtella]|nr:hypothetical protein C2S52_016347 [Perilla frutescens var. hirtella]